MKAFVLLFSNGEAYYENPIEDAPVGYYSSSDKAQKAMLDIYDEKNREGSIVNYEMTYTSMTLNLIENTPNETVFSTEEYVIKEITIQ